MDKNLIDLQINQKSTCVLIETKDATLLAPSVQINANVSDKFLFAGEKPEFAENLDKRSQKDDLFYLVIKNIDKVDEEKQLRFVGLVKDREMNGYNMPKQCIIVFTVENKENIKNIAKDLAHLAILAF